MAKICWNKECCKKNPSAIGCGVISATQQVRDTTRGVTSTAINTAGQAGQWVAGGGWIGFVIRNGKKFYKNQQGKWFNESGQEVADLGVPNDQLSRLSQGDMPPGDTGAMSPALKIGLIIGGVLLLGTATFFIVRAIRK